MPRNVVEIIIRARDRATPALKGVKGSISTLAPIAAKAAKGVAIAGATIVASLAAVVASASKAGDQFQKMALRTGVSEEKLSALAHAADLSGSSIHEVEKGLKTLAKRMLDADNGLTEAQRSFDRIGVSVHKADGNLKDVDEVLLEVADKLSSLSSETERAALMQEIFGRAGTRMLPMLKAGRKGIEEMMEEAKELGLVFSKDAAKASADFRDNLSRLTGAAKGITYAIGEELIPIINKLIKESLPKIKQVVSGVGELTRTILKALGALKKTEYERLKGELALLRGQLGLTTYGIMKTFGAQELFTDEMINAKEIGRQLIETHKERVKQLLKEMAALKAAEQALKDKSEAEKEPKKPKKPSKLLPPPFPKSRLPTEVVTPPGMIFPAVLEAEAKGLEQLEEMRAKAAQQERDRAQALAQFKIDMEALALDQFTAQHEARMGLVQQATDFAVAAATSEHMTRKELALKGLALVVRMVGGIAAQYLREQAASELKAAAIEAANAQAVAVEAGGVATLAGIKAAYYAAHTLIPGIGAAYVPAATAFAAVAGGAGAAAGVATGAAAVSVGAHLAKAAAYGAASIAAQATAEVAARLLERKAAEGEQPLSFAGGGYVPPGRHRAILHGPEFVNTPAQLAQMLTLAAASGSSPINVNATFNGPISSNVDVDRMGERLGFALERGRRRALMVG